MSTDKTMVEWLKEFGHNSPSGPIEMALRLDALTERVEKLERRVTVLDDPTAKPPAPAPEGVKSLSDVRSDGARIESLSIRNDHLRASLKDVLCACPISWRRHGPFREAALLVGAFIPEGDKP